MLERGGITFLRCQSDVDGGDVLLHMGNPLGARNGNDAVALGRHPGKGDLGEGTSFRGGNCLDDGDQLSIGLDISRLEAGGVRRKSPGSMSVATGTCPVRKPRPSGLNGTKAMPSSRHVSRTPFVSTSRVQSEYSLRKAATGWMACARRNVSAETSDRPITRTVPALTRSAIAPTVSSTGTAGSKPMKIIKIDHIRLKPLQRGFGDGARIFWPPVGSGDIAEVDSAAVEDEAELGGDEDTIVIGFECLTEQNLIAIRTVNLGRVEKHDAEIRRAMQGAHGSVLVL